ncbi:MAG: SIS domain-containing protein [Pseudomonadales bacterium]|nr:SIS domain-containing protein [Halioglobus sp.]MCP5131487.1 SIS domain-containing protein [Pseudomonadales bacterium]
MDYYQLISNNFQSTIETIALSVDELAEPLAQASELIVQALLQDRKIVACGNGVDGALAQLFACNLLSRFDEDRPALPALALNSDGACLTSIAHTTGLNDIYARQLRALGQAGDVLLCISSAGEASNLLRAVQAAHERNMVVIVMSNATDGELGTLLLQGDVEIRVDSLRRPRVVELHAMVIHSLCELVEYSLFGNHKPG